MLKIKHLKSLFAVLVLVLAVWTPQLAAQSAEECRNTIPADRAADCFARLETDIQEEIRARCGEPPTDGGGADAFDRCSTDVREAFNEGDRNMNGVPDNDEGDADPSAGAVLDADCKEDGPDANDTALDKEDCGIVGYIVTFTNALAILVGIVIVIMIAVGGIQYTTARDDPQQVSAAKTRIRNAILALVFYLFTFAFLNYLVPGGVF
jgi:hypothetical protein